MTCEKTFCSFWGHSIIPSKMSPYVLIILNQCCLYLSNLHVLVSILLKECEDGHFLLIWKVLIESFICPSFGEYFVIRLISSGLESQFLGARFFEDLGLFESYILKKFFNFSVRLLKKNGVRHRFPCRLHLRANLGP